MRSVLFTLVLGGLAAGCFRHDDSRMDCGLSRGEVVVHSAGLHFDGLGLANLDQGRTLAAWSEANGVWVRSLGADNRPLGEPHRVTDRCTGGIDLKGDGSRYWLGCSRPALEGGATVVYALDAQGQMLASYALGSVGRDGRGIALAPHDARIDVLYHEGALGHHVLHWVRLDRAGNRLEDRRVSSPERVGAEPAALARGEHTFFVWSETPLADATKTQIWAMRDDASPTLLTETTIEAPSPGLRADGDALLLSFRDQKRRDKRPEFYVAALHDSLQVKQAPQRVGRANSQGAPSLLACGSLRAAVLPREYGGEYYIAVHPLDAQHRNLGGGHQYYESNREFVLAAATCSQGQLAMLIGERAHPARPGVALIAFRYTCQFRH